MILYRLLGNIRKSGYFGIAHSLFTAHFKNVPLRGGQLLLSYRQLVDKVIVIYFFYGSVIQKMFVFTKAYVIFKIRTVDLLAENIDHMVLGNREQHGFERAFNRQGGTHVPQLEKRLLHDIFSLDNGLRMQQGETVQRIRVHII